MTAACGGSQTGSLRSATTRWLLVVRVSGDTPWLGRVAAVPGARLHADTPRGPPPLTGLNPTVYWCRNQPSPAGRDIRAWMVVPTFTGPVPKACPSDRQNPLHRCARQTALISPTVCRHATQCSPTPAIFWWTKYSTKDASSSLLLGPNPFHHPPQCGTYTSFILCLFSKDVSSLAKYMLAIIFPGVCFQHTLQGRWAHCAESNR